MHCKVKNLERVKITDIFRLIRDNKALRIKLISQLFDGFIWTFLFRWLFTMLSGHIALI